VFNNLIKKFLYLQVDFNFESCLEKIGNSFVALKVLVLQGLKQIEIDAEAMEDFLQSLSEKSTQLEVSIYKSGIQLNIILSKNEYDHFLYNLILLDQDRGKIICNQNESLFQHLDLIESNLNSTCFEIISKMTSLKSKN